MCVARVARDRKKNKQKEARKDLALLSKAEQQSYKDDEDDDQQLLLDNCWKAMDKENWLEEHF